MLTLPDDGELWARVSTYLSESERERRERVLAWLREDPTVRALTALPSSHLVSPLSPSCLLSSLLLSSPLLSAPLLSSPLLSSPLLASPLRSLYGMHTRRAQNDEGELKGAKKVWFRVLRARGPAVSQTGFNAAHHTRHADAPNAMWNTYSPPWLRHTVHALGWLRRCRGWPVGADACRQPTHLLPLLSSLGVSPCLCCGACGTCPGATRFTWIYVA